MSIDTEIQSLIVRQKRVGDAQDEAAMRDCWSRTQAALHVVRNGVEAGADGFDAVMAFTLHAWRSGRHGVDHIHLHFAGPMEIEVLSEDRGRAIYGCLYISTEPSAYKVIGYGEYTDDVVREDGQWRLARRAIKQMFSAEGPRVT